MDRGGPRLEGESRSKPPQVVRKDRGQCAVEHRPAVDEGLRDDAVVGMGIGLGVMGVGLIVALAVLWRRFKMKRTSTVVKAVAVTSTNEQAIGATSAVTGAGAAGGVEMGDESKI